MRSRKSTLDGVLNMDFIVLMHDASLPSNKKSILYNFTLLSQEFTNPNLKLANQPGFKGQSESKLELYFWVSE